MLSKQAAYVLERSCSTGARCRIKRGWRAEAGGLVLATGAACWPKFREINERARVRVGASEHGWVRVVLCACRGVGGDVPRLVQGAGHPRITQRRRVGALEPKLHSLGVAG